MKLYDKSIEILRNFCDNTNLHGFAYISRSSKYKYEQLFWIFSITTSLILTGTFIHKLIIENQKTPIVIYTDQSIIPVTDINFPSLTFCPNTVLRKAQFGKVRSALVLNYLEYKEKIDKGVLKLGKLKKNFQKHIQILNLLNHEPFKIDLNLSIPLTNFMTQLEETLLEYTGERFSKNGCGILGHWLEDTLIAFWKVLGPNGFCYTFNYPNSSNIFHLDRISSDFNYTYYSIAMNGVNLKDNKLSYVAPLKGHESGKGLKMDMSDYCNTPEFENYTIPWSPFGGHKLIVHDPYEVISSSSYQLRTTQYHRTEVLITPIIYGYDESFKDYGIETRQCYLPDENPLEFFKIYNKVNCEHECLAKLTLELCNCTQFFMVRNQTTRVCGLMDEKCFYEVEREFDNIKGVCRCFDSCERLKYDIQVLTKVDDTTTTSPIEVRFKVEYTNILRKRQQYTIFELLSLIGGFLGLFAGLSVLSTVELLYFFIFHPIAVYRHSRSTKVYPFDEKTVGSPQGCLMGGRLRNCGFMVALLKKSWTFLKEYSEGTTIHGFNHIVDSKKSIFNRLLWLASVTSSLILSYFITKEVYQKLKSSEIVVTMEGSSISADQIPFPAVTLTRNLFKEYEYSKFSVAYGMPTDEAIEKLNNVKHQIFLTLCNKNYLETHDNILSFVDFDYEKPTDFVDYLRHYTNKYSFVFGEYTAKWNEQDSPVFVETLTSKGMGFSFNMAEMDRILDVNEVIRGFYYSNSTNSSTQLLNSPKNTNNGLKFEFYIPDIYRVCTRSSFAVHSPYELPIQLEMTEFRKNIDYEVLITPEIYKSEEGLKDVDLKIRKCYFDGEKKLKFFKTYTQRNCELECLTVFNWERCKCVPFDLIRNSTMDVCDFAQTYHQHCRMSSLSYFLGLSSRCKCLPSCDLVTYSYEIRQTKRKERTQNATLSFHFKDNEYFAQLRYRPFKIIDFLSYVGGIFGLFAGISVLSIVELIYFFTIRPFVDCVRHFRFQGAAP